MRPSSLISVPYRILKAFLWSVLGLIGLALVVVFVVTLIIVYVVRGFSDSLPDVTSSHNLFRLQQTSFITDRSGEQILYEIIGDEDRIPLQLSEIDPKIIASVLATEDSNYWQHSGYDLTGIIMAGCHEIGSLIQFTPLTSMCPPRGGSTITQQLVKNIILTNERSYERKAKEILIAHEIESNYSKQAILQMYLNSVSFGSLLYGVEAATQGYFGKSARDVTLAEASILAALIQRPGALSPWGGQIHSSLTARGEELMTEQTLSIEQVLTGEYTIWTQGLIGASITLPTGELLYLPGRTDHVLQRLLETGEIGYMQYDQALKDLQLITFENFRVDITHPHYVMTVRELLPTLISPEVIAEGGLKVRTALDVTLQTKAEELVRQRVEQNVRYQASNAAAVLLRPRSGEILAMVGGADYWNDTIDGQVNVATSPRQVGSTIKPFVYALGIFANKITPDMILNDAPIEFEDGWSPRNSDLTYRGKITAARALAESRNVPAALVSKLVGYNALYDFLQQLGISFAQSADFYGHPLSLGTAEISPIELAAAYASFTNGGQRVSPVFVLDITDRNGNVIYRASDTPNLHPVYPDSVAQDITKILSNKSLRPSYWNDVLQIGDNQIAVKTGTSNKIYNSDSIRPGDAWTSGYTPEVVVTVWAGNTDGSPLGPDGYGLNAAAPLWRSLMELLLEEGVPQ